jgi:hypothetical protein
MKYRLPDGRQVQRRIGPVWTSKREEPPPGHFTKRPAQAALDETLAKALRGDLGGVAQTRATFAEAADEWLRYVEHDRERKRSTITDYRHMVDRMKDELGALPLTDLTPARLEAYRDSLMERGLANRTVNKYLVSLHGIFQRALKVHGLPANPMTLVEKRPNRQRAHIEVYSREGVTALVRAAASERDAALYMTAAFTGLRMGKLLALRWRDVDFELQAVHVRRSFTGGKEDTPKSGASGRFHWPTRWPGPSPVSRGERTSSATTPDLLRHPGRPPHANASPGALQASDRGGWAVRASLSRPAPHIRHPRDPHSRQPRGHGVDGPPGPEDDPDLPLLQAPARRRGTDLARVSRRKPASRLADGMRFRSSFSFASLAKARGRCRLDEHG